MRTKALYGVMGMAGALFFAALPATSNYKLNSYGFGSGGTVNSQTSTYSLEGITGELTGQNSTRAGYTYGGDPGFIQTQQANVPQLASIDNGSGLYYNKLHFVIDTQCHTTCNPTDTQYLIAVSTTATVDANGNFTTGTQYVQPDGTLSSTLNLSDYQTYATWGSTTGSYIIGLTQNTTYYVHLRATQGAHTESAFGPVSTQATAAATLSFSLATSSQATPPFSIALGTLSAGTIATSAQTINTGLTTNGASGGDVYVKGQNGGLLSGSTGYKIAAVSSDLSVASEGFGAQNSSVTQTSGGPYTVVAPYNTSGTSVGIIDTTTRSIYTATTPVTSGSGILKLLAKAAATDTAATDYQEVLTFTAAANF